MLEIDSIPAPFLLVKVDHRSGDRRPEAEHHQLKQCGTILLLFLKAVNWSSQHISKGFVQYKQGNLIRDVDATLYPSLSKHLLGVLKNLIV